MHLPVSGSWQSRQELFRKSIFSSCAASLSCFLPRGQVPFAKRPVIFPQHEPNLKRPLPNLAGPRTLTIWCGSTEELLLTIFRLHTSLLRPAFRKEPSRFPYPSTQRNGFRSRAAFMASCLQTSRATQLTSQTTIGYCVLGHS